MGEIYFNSLGNLATRETGLVGRRPHQWLKNCMLHEKDLESGKKPHNSSEEANATATAFLQRRPSDHAEHPKKEDNERDASYTPPGKFNHKL